MYHISLKSQKTVSNDARYILGRFLDEEWLSNTYYSIIEKSISHDKMQKLAGNGGRIDIGFSVNGKVLKIRMYFTKETIDILNESDLLTLDTNLRKFDMDMSKIELEYPVNWVKGTEAIWGFTFPVKKRVHQIK
jgi:hypothetical protein